MMRKIPAGRPDCPPATSYEVMFCEGPDCGAHIIGYRGDVPVLEIVQSKEQTRAMVELCTVALDLLKGEGHGGHG